MLAAAAPGGGRATHVEEVAATRAAAETDHDTAGPSHDQPQNKDDYGRR